jgi:hypothetical protein
MIPTLRIEEKKLRNIETAFSYKASLHQQDYRIDDPKEVAINGSGELRFKEQSVRIADCGIEKIFKFLGIPRYYASRISDRFLVETINRLFHETKKGLLIRTQKIRCDSNEYAVTSILHLDYHSIQDEWILEHIYKLGIKAESVCYSPRMLRLVIVTEKEFMPFPNDAFKLGLEIANSENNFIPFCINAYYHRLVCANGLVATKVYNDISVKAKNGIRRKEIEGFINSALSKIKEKANKTVKRIQRMSNIQIDEEDLLRIRRRVTRYVGTERAKRDFSNFAENYYNITNKLTAIAREQVSFIRRRELEVYAGNLLLNSASKN